MVDTAITMTSVSFALMVMSLLPCDVASLACTNTLVSASSWKHGATASRDLTLLSQSGLGEFQSAVTFEMYGACRFHSVKQELLGSDA